VPLPRPVAPELTLTNGASDDADQLHVAPVVTCTSNVVALAPTDVEGGDTVYAQEAGGVVAAA
jgi:hypothetical protein